MKFLEVVLTNVFAYDGPAVFDLSDTTPDKNIVLIWGRNGVGKTSFLRSVKLLFTGATTEVRNNVTFPRQRLSLSQFMNGDAGSWTGVLNRAARRRSEAQNQPTEASIAATWETDGGQYTAVRWWSVLGADVSEGVYVDPKGGERLAAEAAEDFLQHTLPSDFIDFFFFDGEEIKTMAETSGTQQKHFDRLLQITFVDDLATELENIAKDRRRRNLGTTIRDQLTMARNELNKAASNLATYKERLSDCEDGIVSDGIELRRLYLRRTNLSSGASEVQREALETRRTELQKRLETLTEEIVSQLPPDVPVISNLRIIKQVADQVDARLASGGSAEANFVRGVSVQLPQWIAESAPELSTSKVDHISSHVRGKLHDTLDEVSASGLFAGADLLRMERLRTDLEFWLVAGVERREAQARILLEAHRTKSDLSEVDEALLHIEVGAQGNVEEYRRVANRIAELEEAVATRNQEKGSLVSRIADEQKRQQQLTNDIARLESSNDQATSDAKDYRYVIDIARALNEISEALRKGTREELEEMLNERFRRIISHQLIGRIHVDDTYTLSFTDRSGKALGRSSISSGMKQLVATALLWALKDSAGTKMPVIIDTPLGRIDKQNQEHLLRHYYPALSHQVIVLPTNSELDPAKFATLEPRVARQYVIVNTSGDAARVDKGSFEEVV